jgi:hypothetical protein
MIVKKQKKLFVASDTIVWVVIDTYSGNYFQKKSKMRLIENLGETIS